MRLAQKVSSPWRWLRLVLGFRLVARLLFLDSAILFVVADFAVERAECDGGFIVIFWELRSSVREGEARC